MHLLLGISTSNTLEKRTKNNNNGAAKFLGSQHKVQAVLLFISYENWSFFGKWTKYIFRRIFRKLLEPILGIFAR